MQIVDVTDETDLYAIDVQDAIHTVMKSYAESVGFESQMAIMGVAIGAILFQLPDHDREYYTRVFIENMSGADSLSQLMVMH